MPKTSNKALVSAIKLQRDSETESKDIAFVARRLDTVESGFRREHQTGRRAKTPGCEL